MLGYFYTLPWPNSSCKQHSWSSLHQTGDELKSLLIHLPSRECFPSWQQVWHGHELHTLIPLSEQQCEDCLTRRHLAGDTAVTHPLNGLNDIPTSLRICEKYWHFSWQDFKKQILPDKSVYWVKCPTLLQATKIQTSNTAFRLHNQRSARNMFYCAYKLCMKYLTSSLPLGKFLEALMPFLSTSKGKPPVCSPGSRRPPILLQTHEWKSPWPAFCFHSFPPTCTISILQSHPANYYIRASGKGEAIITSQGLITLTESENHLGWKRALRSSSSTVHPALNHQHLLVFTELQDMVKFYSKPWYKAPNPNTASENKLITFLLRRKQWEELKDFLVLFFFPESQPAGLKF